MSTHKAPTYLYLCISEADNNEPFQYDWTLVTGNISDVESLLLHKLVDICPCVATEECGIVGMGYHRNSLRDSTQKVLTLVQLAKIKDYTVLEETLHTFD